MQVEETTPSTPLRPTRAGFVRGLPLTMPVEEVIERGREVGIELQPSDIHAARYYMRQAAAAESSSIPQQLLLGGTFVTKREPRNGSANGASKAASTNGQSVEKASAPAIQVQRDLDEPSDEPEPEVITPRRGRKAAVKAEAHASRASKADKAEAKQKAAGGLHSRLQARLRNATFRETAREEREPVREQKLSAGKALLLDLDNALKQPKSKRATQATETLEEQLRLIALRLGTQRAREILDHMEELARRA